MSQKTKKNPKDSPPERKSLKVAAIVLNNGRKSRPRSSYGACFLLPNTKQFALVKKATFYKYRNGLVELTLVENKRPSVNNLNPTRFHVKEVRVIEERYPDRLKNRLKDLPYEKSLYRINKTEFSKLILLAKGKSPECVFKHPKTGNIYCTDLQKVNRVSNTEVTIEDAVVFNEPVQQPTSLLSEKPLTKAQKRRQAKKDKLAKLAAQRLLKKDKKTQIQALKKQASKDKTTVKKERVAEAAFTGNGKLAQLANKTAKAIRTKITGTSDSTRSAKLALKNLKKAGISTELFAQVEFALTGKTTSDDANADNATSANTDTDATPVSNNKKTTRNKKNVKKNANTNTTATVSK